MAGPIKGPPDFSAGINPNDFTVPGGDQTVSALKQANGAAQSISYDWSGVDSALQGYTGVAQAWDARAGGQGENGGRPGAARSGGLISTERRLQDAAPYVF